MRTSKYKEPNLRIAIEGSSNWREVCEKMDVSISGRMRSYMRKKSMDYGISFEHFVRGSGPIMKTLQEMLDNPNTSSVGLRLRLVKEGIKEERCEWCNNTEWLGEPIPLQLDHVDGNHSNNKLENLQVLCPTCHAVKTRKDRFANRKTRECLKCGIKISASSSRGMCRSCAQKLFNRATRSTRISWPTNEDLILMIQNSSCEAVSRDLGVTGNAVRHRLKTRGLM